MSKIVIFNGAPQSGKTTLEYMCKVDLERWGYEVHITSTVHFVKEIAIKCGWDGQKSPESRAFLSDLKDLLTHAPWGDVPYEKIMGEVRAAEAKYKEVDASTDKVVFFVDVREPEGIKKFVEENNAMTVVVRRDEAEKALTSNHADANVLNFEYDYKVTNNEGLEELKRDANTLSYLITKW